jgi:hypothetical protein
MSHHRNQFKFWRENMSIVCTLVWCQIIHYHICGVVFHGRHIKTKCLLIVRITITFVTSTYNDLLRGVSIQLYMTGQWFLQWYYFPQANKTDFNMSAMKHTSSSAHFQVNNWFQIYMSHHRNQFKFWRENMSIVCTLVWCQIIHEIVWILLTFIVLSSLQTIQHWFFLFKKFKNDNVSDMICQYL